MSKIIGCGQVENRVVSNEELLKRYNEEKQLPISALILKYATKDNGFVIVR